MFVDTSAWVALAVRRDASYEAASRFLKESHQRSFVTTDYVFDETITTIRRMAGHTAAVATGDALRKSLLARIERVSPEDFEAAWKIFERHADQELSFTDCTSAAVMRRLGIREAFAFDQDFLRLGFVLRPGSTSRT